MKNLAEMTMQEIRAYEAHLKDYELDLKRTLLDTQNILANIKNLQGGGIEDEDANA